MAPAHAGAFFCPAPDNRDMQYLSVDAPPLLAATAHALRPVARRLALACAVPAPQLAARAAATGVDSAIGRVQSGGAWHDAEVHAQLAAVIDAPLRHALRDRFEWYVCRGAFFHTDAHYADVLFGVWYIAGPPVDLVFPRAGQRVAARPGTLAIFDPYEVHGVLCPGAPAYCEDDYVGSPPSVFVGFELQLDDRVRACFDALDAATDARLLTSSTRVTATTGAFE